MRPKPGIPKSETTTIGFSCSRRLKAQIEAAAAADRRNVSNWIVRQLEQTIQELEAAERERSDDPL